VKLRRLFDDALMLGKAIGSAIIAILIFGPVALLLVAVFIFMLLIALCAWAIGMPVTVKQGNKVIGRIRWFKYYPTEK
jgi:uncharacterized membrane protein